MNIKEILNGYAQEGFDYITTYDEEQAIVKYIEENKEQCPVPLYRGMMVDEDYSVEIGSTIDFDHSFSSFDEDSEKALEFATRLGYGLVYTIEGVEGLPLYMHSSTCHDEQEWLLLDGEYEVTELTKEGDVHWVKIIKK